MGHKRQVRRFAIFLLSVALASFIFAVIYKFVIFTILGYLTLISGLYLKYHYLPGLKKKKTEKKVVLEEVKSGEVLDLSDKIKLYWDKFIVWLHT